MVEQWQSGKLSARSTHLLLLVRMVSFEAYHNQGRVSLWNSTLEVLPVDGRSRDNRRWPGEIKVRIVAEMLLPGATVGSVAGRHGLPADHVRRGGLL